MRGVAWGRPKVEGERRSEARSDIEAARALKIDVFAKVGAGSTDVRIRSQSAHFEANDARSGLRDVPPPSTPSGRALLVPNRFRATSAASERNWAKPDPRWSKTGQLWCDGIWAWTPGLKP